jgi:protein-ribulosamine 3-kinase
MCEGEFESLKAIHAVSPTYVPEPYGWGKYSQEGPETHFLLVEFRDVGEQVRLISLLEARLDY